MYFARRYPSKLGDGDREVRFLSLALRVSVLDGGAWLVTNPTSDGATRAINNR